MNKITKMALALGNQRSFSSALAARIADGGAYIEVAVLAYAKILIPMVKVI